MEPTNQSKQLTLSVSVEEANLLIAGLGKLPLEASAQLWMKIRGQAAEQLSQPDPQAAQHLQPAEDKPWLRD